MSDPTDAGQRNPLSSSSSHASGTSALSVSVQSDRGPGVTMVAQDDVTAPAPSSGGEVILQAGPESQSESGREFEPETSQPSVAEQPEPDSEPEAVAEFAPSSEPALEAHAEYDQPLMAASIGSSEEAPAEASAFVEEPVSAADEPDDDGDVDMAASEAPSAEAAIAAGPGQSASFPDATSELRAVARQTIAENEARQKKALELFEQVSRRFTVALEEAGEDAARVTFKVMEFAQASLKNNLELAKAYAAARSVPDIFGLHTAYITRQFELLNAQAEELRDITAKIALRNTASLKPRPDPAGKPLDNR